MFFIAHNGIPTLQDKMTIIILCTIDDLISERDFFLATQ